jgi:hypothetical protein
MTPDVSEHLRLGPLQCRAVVSLMRKWAADEDSNDVLCDSHPANTLQWTAGLAIQVLDGALNDLDIDFDQAPGSGDQHAKLRMD